MYTNYPHTYPEQDVRTPPVPPDVFISNDPNIGAVYLRPNNHSSEGSHLLPTDYVSFTSGDSWNTFNRFPLVVPSSSPERTVFAPVNEEPHDLGIHPK